MKNLIANPLTCAAIAGAAVWLASVLMAHGQDGKPVLVEQVADVTGSGSDYRAVKSLVLSD